MLDSTPQETLTEQGLDETKLSTELDRLADDEIRRMRLAIVKAERRATDAAIAAGKVDGGARFTEAELVATCSAALSLALKGTRGMRLTADDWADLRSDLVLAALERGAAKNVERGERRGMLPRRDDLADGKAISWLAGTARRMLADLAATDAPKGAPAPDEATTEDVCAVVSDLTTDDLCGIVGMDTFRVRLAIRAATEGGKLADLCADMGKLKSQTAATTAATKGRDAIRASVTPEAIRAAAAAIREGEATEAPTEGTVALYPAQPPRRVAHPTRADVLAYIGAVLDSATECPAAAAEQADRATRWTNAARRETPSKATPLDGPLAPTPEGVGRLIGRKVRAAALDSMRRVPAYLSRCTCLTRHPDAPCEGCDTYGQPRILAEHIAYRPQTILSGATYAPAPDYRPSTSTYRPTLKHERKPLQVSSAPSKPHRAYGPMTEQVTATLSDRRRRAMSARTVAREAQRRAAEQAGKLTILEPSTN